MMRKLLIFLALFAILISSAFAASSWYPKKIGTGSELQTDAGSARNGEALIAIQTIPAAETSDDDQIINATGGALNQTTNLIINSSGAGSAYFIAQPDVPRNIIATWNATTSGSLRINGTDIAGVAISENLTVSSGTTAASTRAFKTITGIDADLTTGQTAKTVKIGTGDLLGLNTRLAFDDSVLFTLVNGAKETTAPAVTTNSTVLSLNTIDTYTAPGGHVTVVYYVV